MVKIQLLILFLKNIFTKKISFVDPLKQACHHNIFVLTYEQLYGNLKEIIDN